MPRRGQIAKRDVLPDPLYNSKLVTRLINSVMLDGKKGVAQKIVYDAFNIIAEQTGKDPLEVFENAMENVMPVLEVKARRVGGATYQVPIEVRPERRETLGLRWLHIVIQRVFRFIWIRNITRITDSAFYDLSGLQGFFHWHLHIFHPVQAVKNTEHINTAASGNLNKLLDHIIRIIAVSNRIRRTNQNLAKRWQTWLEQSE